MLIPCHYPQAFRARPCSSFFWSWSVSGLGLRRGEVPGRSWWQPGQGEPGGVLWQEGAAGGERAYFAQGGLEEDSTACTLWIQSQPCLCTCKASSVTLTPQTFWICWGCSCAKVGSSSSFAIISIQGRCWNAEISVPGQLVERCKTSPLLTYKVFLLVIFLVWLSASLEVPLLSAVIHSMNHSKHFSDFKTDVNVQLFRCYFDGLFRLLAVNSDMWYLAFKFCATGGVLGHW